MSYCAVYEFDSYDLVQIAAVIKSGDDTTIQQLFGWLESHLMRLDEASLSLRIHAHAGTLTRTLRIAFKGDQTQADELSHLLRQQDIVDHMLTERDAFDAQFSVDYPHIAMVPNQVYTAANVELVTDYVLLNSLEEIAVNLAMSQVDFCYQLNAGLVSEKSEVNRFIRKSVVHLEEKPGVPQKLIQHQRRFASRAQHADWIGEEFFSCSSDKEFRYISDMVAECFADEQEKFGFPRVDLVKNDEVTDQFFTGLLARNFESLSIAEEASQLVSAQQIAKPFSLTLPHASVKATAHMPRAVSDKGKWDVFLSHSSKDHLTTKAVCHYLESQGIRCWMAPRDIPVGDLWSNAIMQGIKGCKATVLVFSGPANESRYVLREIEQSVSLNLPILPLRIEDLPPSDSLSFFISSHHWFDAVNEQLEARLPELKAAILPHIKQSS